MTLHLIPDYESMTASWNITGDYEEFKVMIKTDAYNFNAQTVNTKELNHTFKNLKAGVYYTVSVVTVNGNFTSAAAEYSDYTRE